MARRDPRDIDAARRLAVMAAQLAHERNAEDVNVLDLRELSGVTDFFVIATGTSDRQMRSIADELSQVAKKQLNQKVYRIAGQDAGDWIVIDFVDVVVHLFTESLRQYYDLDLIWGEAPRIDWAAG